MSKRSKSLSLSFAEYCLNFAIWHPDIRRQLNVMGNFRKEINDKKLCQDLQRKILKNV